MRPYIATAPGTPAVPSAPVLPATFWEAAKRGVMSKCPRCGEAPLFRKWLKSVDQCAGCGQDWSHHRADDFPAYIAILVVGHLLAPVMIAMSVETDLSPLAIVSILLPASAIMMLGMLQPTKGAVIAAQWWNGMHGFIKERLPQAASGADVIRPDVPRPE